jgi:hypothetical protein
MNKQSTTKEAPMPAQHEITDYIRHHGDILDTIEELAKFANAMPQPTRNGTQLDVSPVGLRSARLAAISCRDIQMSLKAMESIK